MAPEWTNLELSDGQVGRESNDYSPLLGRVALILVPLLDQFQGVVVKLSEKATASCGGEQSSTLHVTEQACSRRLMVVGSSQSVAKAQVMGG